MYKKGKKHVISQPNEVEAKKATTTKYDYVICKNCRRTNGYLASEIAPGSGILVNSSVEFHVVPKRVKKYQLSILYSSVLNNRPLLIITWD